MSIQDFFNNKEKVEKFINAKTEQEARNLLETYCGKISDEDFADIKTGISAAVDENVLKEVSGGLSKEGVVNKLKSPIAKTVYACAGALFLGGISYQQGHRKGYGAGQSTVYAQLADTLNDVNSRGMNATATFGSYRITKGEGDRWFEIKTTTPSD